MNSEPCIKCRRSYSTPNGYLMICRICRNRWHHTCLDPPMTQRELLNRLKATDVPHTHPMDMKNWCCVKCSGGSSSDEPILIDDDEIVDVRNAPPAPVSASSSTSTLVTNEAVIDLTLDSDDEGGGERRLAEERELACTPTAEPQAPVEVTPQAPMAIDHHISGTPSRDRSESSKAQNSSSAVQPAVQPSTTARANGSTPNGQKSDSARIQSPHSTLKRKRPSVKRPSPDNSSSPESATPTKRTGAISNPYRPLLETSSLMMVSSRSPQQQPRNVVKVESRPPESTSSDGSSTKRSLSPNSDDAPVHRESPGHSRSVEEEYVPDSVGPPTSLIDGGHLSSRRSTPLTISRVSTPRARAVGDTVRNIVSEDNYPSVNGEVERPSTVSIVNGTPAVAQSEERLVIKDEEVDELVDEDDEEEEEEDSVVSPVPVVAATGREDENRGVVQELELPQCKEEEDAEVEEGPSRIEETPEIKEEDEEDKAVEEELSQIDRREVKASGEIEVFAFSIKHEEDEGEEVEVERLSQVEHANDDGPSAIPEDHQMEQMRNSDSDLESDNEAEDIEFLDEEFTRYRRYGIRRVAGKGVSSFDKIAGRRPKPQKAVSRKGSEFPRLEQYFSYAMDLNAGNLVMRQETEVGERRTGIGRRKGVARRAESIGTEVVFVRR